MKRLGFIGIGVMGASMARNLKKAGFEVGIYTRTKEKALPLIEEGFSCFDSAEDCARDRDAVISIVGYPADVEEVYFGEKGVLRGARRGAYLIDMTTTSPAISLKIYGAAKEKGMFALDAPVSGGDTGARNASLAIMVGGDREAFDACAPIFHAMGKSVVYEGAAGSGQHVKMCNQIAIAGAVTGVAEAVAYARAAGVDPETMLQTISGGAAASWQLLNLGPKMAAGDYAPGFFIKHFVKDMRIAAEEAQRAGLRLEVLPKVLSLYEALEKAGLGEEGTQAIVKRYER